MADNLRLISQLLDQSPFLEIQRDGKSPGKAQTGRAVSTHRAVGGELETVVDQDAGFPVVQIQGDRIQGDRVVEQLQTVVGAHLLGCNARLVSALHQLPPGDDRARGQQEDK